MIRHRIWLWYKHTICGWSEADVICYLLYKVRAKHD